MEVRGVGVERKWNKKLHQSFLLKAKIDPFSIPDEAKTATHHFETTHHEGKREIEVASEVGTY